MMAVLPCSHVAPPSSDSAELITSWPPAFRTMCTYTARLPSRLKTTAGSPSACPGAAAGTGLAQIEAEGEADAAARIDDEMGVALDVGQRREIELEVRGQVDAEERNVGERDLHGEDLLRDVVVHHAEGDDLREPID